MNRTEWFASNDPLPMLAWLRQRGSERKFRLFACACLRRVEGLMVGYYDEARPALEAAEREADGVPTDYSPPWQGMWAMGSGPMRETVRATVERLPGLGGWESARQVVRDVHQMLTLVNQFQVGAVRDDGEGRAQAALLRDLFGHLFHEDPLWLARLDRTDEAERIARAIYEAHSFADLPVLADALEDAGCADVEVLEHCRDAGEHARGCWVIDAILGRG